MIERQGEELAAAASERNDFKAQLTDMEERFQASERDRAGRLR